MNSFNTIKILSRKSDLAVIQSELVGSKLLEKYSDLEIEYISKKISFLMRKGESHNHFSVLFKYIASVLNSFNTIL